MLGAEPSVVIPCVPPLSSTDGAKMGLRILPGSVRAACQGVSLEDLRNLYLKYRYKKLAKDYDVRMQHCGSVQQCAP